MECNCQNSNCRKKIQDFKYLPEKIQEEYTQRRIIPKYILKKVAQEIIISQD